MDHIMMARYTNTNVNLESRSPWTSNRKVQTIASNSNHRNPKQTTKINSKTRMLNSSEENRSNTASTKNQKLTNVEAPLLYHPMERLSGKGLMLVVINAK